MKYTLEGPKSALEEILKCSKLFELNLLLTGLNRTPKGPLKTYQFKRHVTFKRNLKRFQRDVHHNWMKYTLEGPKGALE